MEKNAIKISIIFPTYNGENVLQANLSSIQNLSNLDEIELIIIDNNSTDSTKEVIKSCKDVNLRLIEQSRNLGFAKACNIGVLNAKGEFIFITNQDVIFPSKFFQKLKEVYSDYKKKNEFIISPAVIFKGDTIHYFGAKIHFLGFSFTSEIGKKLPKRKVIKNTQRVSGCSLFMKKDLFIEIGGFDNSLFMYCEDTDFSLRILRKGLKIYTTNDPYLIHQKHGIFLSDFEYYLLERNRVIVFIKNIENFKKLLPIFIITELILIGHSILIKKFNLRIRMYYELLSKLKLFKKLRSISRKNMELIPYQKLYRSLDSILLGKFYNLKIFVKLLNMFNLWLKLI